MSGDFAGDLFLTLAAEGRLVLDPVSADEVVAGLERTLALVRSRLRILRLWEQLPVQRLDELPAELRQDVVDAVFVDQLTPGRLERAVVELPKYIEALRSAGRLPPVV
ncbi:hypothetical protein [Actinoplanes sp. NPDC049118]|uniref:hypothetical protein n=1 Tax=Actinoplanes sp. NPDC049118 TaxID=3155769 RepID=UPI0033F6D9E9